MRITTMEYVSGLLRGVSPYCAFMRWNGSLPLEPYFVWEYTESPSMTLEENGHQETTVILRGYTQGTWMQLEEAKEKIEKACGVTAILKDGTGIAVSYDSAMVVPTGDAQLKSIKINLTIQEWKVN